MLLKAREFENSSRSSQVFHLGDIEYEARQMIERAQGQCDQMKEQFLAQAEKEKEQARQKGFSQGHEEGLKAGIEQGRQEAFEQGRSEFSERSAAGLGSLEAILQEFQSRKDRVLWQGQQDTLRLAVRIAEKVVKVKVQQCVGSVFEANLKESLDLVGGHTRLKVRVNPADLAYLKEMSGRPDGFLDEYADVAFEADEAISSGGCVIVSGKGRMDGRIETQIDRIAEELVLGGPQQEEDEQEETK